MGWKITVLAVLALAALACSPAARADEPVAKVGTFDLRKILDELRPDGAVKKKEKTQQGDSLPTGDPLKSKEAQEIRDKMAKIGKDLDRKGLSKAEREKLEAEVGALRKQLVRMRRDAMGKKNTKTPQTSEDPVKDSERRLEAMEVVTRYAQEKGFVFLFEKGYWFQGEQQKAIVFRGKPIDVTDEIIQRVEAKVQTDEQPKK